MSSKKDWENYEIVSRGVINKINRDKNKLHLSRTEGKQKIKGRSGVEYEMEIVAYDSSNVKPILIECKHWRKSRIPQDILAAFAYKIRDVGGERGFIVVSTDLQRGAQKIADLENIEIIKLNYDATASRFDLVLPKRGEYHAGVVARGKVEDKVVKVDPHNRMKS